MYTRSQGVVPTAIFLGAGASRAFDFPTTTEFLTNVRSKLEEKSHERALLDTFREVPGVEDIEHVLDLLDQFTEQENPVLKFLSHRKVHVPSRPVYFAASSIPWEQFVTLCEIAA